MPSKSNMRRPQSMKETCNSQGHSPSDLDSQEPSPFYRVRSFKSNSKGIINRGDSFKRKRQFGSSGSVDSTTSCPDRVTQMRHDWSHGSRGSSVASSLDIDSPASFRVVILGAPGVGKTSIIQQFLTSEYMGNEDPALG